MSDSDCTVTPLAAELVFHGKGHLEPYKAHGRCSHEGCGQWAPLAFTAPGHHAKDKAENLNSSSFLCNLK